MNKKIEDLQKVIAQKELDGIYLNDEKTVFYLLGLRTTNGHILITKSKIIFLTDGRYIYATNKLLKDTFIEVLNISEIKYGISTLFKENNLEKVGIEYKKIMLDEYNNLKLKARNVDFVSIDENIEEMRMYKTDEEIEIIKEGIKIHERIYTEVIESVYEGITELELKTKFDCLTLKETPLGVSFETIVAFGENSALPHHHSSDRKLKKGDAILIDCGINYKGYCTDMTRTCFFGFVPTELQKAYGLVEEAIKIGEENAKKGEFTSLAHKKVVDFFKSKGVEKKYLHSLGHGVGIDIHEKPSLGLKDSEKFHTNVVFTIEPGLYYENIGGIRLENMYFISTNGLKNLNNIDYKLRVI